MLVLLIFCIVVWLVGAFALAGIFDIASFGWPIFVVLFVIGAILYIAWEILKSLFWYVKGRKYRKDQRIFRAILSSRNQ